MLCVFETSPFSKSNLQPVHSVALLSAIEATTDMPIRADRWPGHLISCQQCPQLQVNRSPSSPFSVTALTGLDFDSSLLTLEMSWESVFPP